MPEPLSGGALGYIHRLLRAPGTAAGCGVFQCKVSAGSPGAVSASARAAFPGTCVGARRLAAGWDLKAGCWFSYRADMAAWEQVCYNLQNLKILRVQAKRPDTGIKGHSWVQK